MPNISHLLGEAVSFGDRLCYTTHSAGEQHGTHTGAVVVWNITRPCNPRCGHCYELRCRQITEMTRKHIILRDIEALKAWADA